MMYALHTLGIPGTDSYHTDSRWPAGYVAGEPTDVMEAIAALTALSGEEFGTRTVSGPTSPTDDTLGTWGDGGVPVLVLSASVDEHGAVYDYGPSANIAPAHRACPCETSICGHWNFPAARAEGTDADAVRAAFPPLLEQVVKRQLERPILRVLHLRGIIDARTGAVDDDSDNPDAFEPWRTPKRGYVEETREPTRFVRVATTPSRDRHGIEVHAWGTDHRAVCERYVTSMRDLVLDVGLRREILSPR